jgi:hypothetical protein
VQGVAEPLLLHALALDHRQGRRWKPGVEEPRGQYPIRCGDLEGVVAGRESREAGRAYWTGPGNARSRAG